MATTADGTRGSSMVEYLLRSYGSYNLVRQGCCRRVNDSLLLKKRNSSIYHYEIRYTRRLAVHCLASPYITLPCLAYTAQRSLR